MKLNSLVIRLLITANVLIVLTIAPALSDEEQQSRKRAVRVTTGIGAVQGWEQGLVGRNPNLARWHWDPIYYYKQGYGPVTSKKSSIYLKPTGKPTGKQTSNSGMSYQSPATQDSRPEHIPYSPQAMADLQGRLSVPKSLPDNPVADNESVLGKLMDKSTGGEVTATYGKLLPQRQSSLNTGLKYSSQSTSVYGQLLNTKVHNKNYSSRKGQNNRGGNVPKKNQ